MHGTAIRLEKVNRICAYNRTSDVIDDVFTTGLNNSKACPQGQRDQSAAALLSAPDFRRVPMEFELAWAPFSVAPWV